jgi:hypothetical protein
VAAVDNCFRIAPAMAGFPFLARFVMGSQRLTRISRLLAGGPWIHGRRLLGLALTGSWPCPGRVVGC